MKDEYKKLCNLMATDNFTEVQAIKLAKRIKGITGQDVFNNTRKRECIETRSLFNFILYNAKGYSLHDIKRFYMKYGKAYDHSTVLHSLKQFDLYRKYNKNFESWIKELLVDEYDDEMLEALIIKKAKQLDFAGLNRLYEYSEELVKNADHSEQKSEKMGMTMDNPLKEFKARLILAYREADDKKQETSKGLQEALKLMLILEKELN